jgi:transposase InsO family protein
LGRDATIAHRHKPVRIGFDFLHVAVDDHTRRAYVEAHDDERDATAAGFLRRACAWFAGHQVRVQRVLTDNAKVYRYGRHWRAVCEELAIGRRFTKVGCPWTNGKAERFNRTLLCEFAYARPWLSTPTGSPLWTAGSPTTTLDAPTPPWVADHRLAD